MSRTRHTRVIPFPIVWLMSRTHVATPYSEVADDIVERLRANNPPDKLTRQEVGRLVTDALIQHRRDRLDYASVMGHH